MNNSRTFIIIGIILTLFITLAFGLHKVRSEDGYWHLRAGYYEIEHGRPLTRDLFSATREGDPWFNNAWLYQVILAGVHRAAGWPGISLFDAALALLTVILVLWACLVRVRAQPPPGRFADQNPSASGTLIPQLFFPLFWLGLLLMSIRFFTRPDLLSMVLAACFVLVLTLHRAGGKGWLLWLLLPVMVIWANSHSLFMFGIIAALAFWFDALGDVVGKLRQPGVAASQLQAADLFRALAKHPPFIRLSLLLAALVLAAMVSPYGIGNLVMLFSYSGGAEIMGSLTEWAPTLTWATLADFNHYGVFKLYLILLITGMVLGYRKLKAGDAFLALAVILIAARYERGLAMLVILTLPIQEDLWHGLVRSWGGRAASTSASTSVSASVSASTSASATASAPSPAHSTQPQTTRPAYRAALWIPLLLVLALCVHQWWGMARWGLPGVGIYQRELPAASADFLEKTEFRGPLFNCYDWGGYLIWRLWPQARVFIDGRTVTLYDNFDFWLYRQALRNPRAFAAAGERAGFDLVLEKVDWVPDFIDQSPQWNTVYLDGLARVMVKSGSPSARRLAPYNLDPVHPRLGFIRPQTSLQERLALASRLDALLVLTPRNPFLHLVRSHLLEDRGQREEALAAARQAVEYDPYDARYLSRVGDLLMALSRPAQALPFYRRVTVLAPRSTDAREALNRAREALTTPSGEAPGSRPSGLPSPETLSSPPPPSFLQAPEGGGAK